MLNELKEVKSSGSPAENQLEALVSALTEKKSRELVDWGDEND